MNDRDAAMYVLRTYCDWDDMTAGEKIDLLRGMKDLYEEIVNGDLK